MKSGRSLVASIKYLQNVLPESSSDYTLKLIRKDDTACIISLEELIAKREAFWRLRNPRYFKQVSIDPLGGLCWPEGEDISPEKVEYYMNRSNGRDAETKRPLKQ